MQIVRLIVSVALAGLLSACAASPYDFPVPTALPDGKRGFGMTGYVQFTSDETKAHAEITKRFEIACQGPITLRSIELNKYTGAINSGYRYNAIAECR